MNIWNEIKKSVETVVFKNYVNFEGRATRPEYWWFTLAYAIVNIILSLIPRVGSVLSGILALAVLIPSIGVGVRRLHDINKSGWWLLLSFIPIVGAIILILWLVKPSDNGENTYEKNTPHSQHHCTGC